jgi:NADH-quinone oxidoreductase subunit C
MTPEEVGAAVVEALGLEDGATSVSAGGQWARATVELAPARWLDGLTAARDGLGFDFFDWLCAVDERDRELNPGIVGGYAIVAHVWSTGQRHGVLFRTLVGGDVDSVVSVYPGAAWHERETHEMFGVNFTGHPNLTPLLLAPEFEGHPLRKDFVLAARVAKAWPGAKEPGESTVDGSAKRQPLRPPGVPIRGEWGPA